MSTHNLIPFEKFSTNFYRLQAYEEGRYEEFDKLKKEDEDIPKVYTVDAVNSTPEHVYFRAAKGQKSEEDSFKVCVK